MFTSSTEADSPARTFTISARGKRTHVRILTFLRRNFGFVTLAEVESIFGFVERSSLYGGRPFVQPELSWQDVMQLNSAGIGLRIPMSNHYVSREEYENSFALLEQYHRRENSVIITNDELAGWIRQDFPQYRLDASVIKNIHTYRQIDAALKLYDGVVLPMYINQNRAFLKGIDAKERIILFANAGCALTCPAKICYTTISRQNKFDPSFLKENEAGCSRELKRRKLLGMVDFDLELLMELGFLKFKLLRPRRSGATGF